MDGRGWSAGLRKMETGTKGAAARMAGSMAGAIGGVFAVGFLASATRRIVQHADTIDKTAKRIGTSTDTIQKFDFAATQSGASMGDVEKAFFNTAKAIESAKQGLTTHIRAFQAFGISMAQLRTMTPEQVFLRIADAIDKAGGAMDKAKSLQDIMGRGGKSLIPAFTAGFSGMAGQAPEGIDPETIQNLVKFNDEMDRLKREALPAAAAAVSMLADTFTMMGEGTGGKGTSMGDRAENLASNMHTMFTPLGLLGGVGRMATGGNFFKGTDTSEDEAQAIVDEANKSRLLTGRERRERRQDFTSGILGIDTNPIIGPQLPNEPAATAAAAATATGWSKPSLQLNSLQRIGAAVSQSADPIAIEKDNNKLLKNIAKNTKKTADNITSDEL